MNNLSQNKPVSIRPFIGSKTFERSRNFYNDLGFNETVLDTGLSLFRWGELGFYLQNAYVKEWVDNTMLFIEVENVQEVWDTLISMELNIKYPEVRLVPIRIESWGQECFLHDPSGILWHFGEFS
ncbi:VOC family protein [Pedobacter psychroterrae]|uniref:Glyoxalase n=1 Tax=Pedobacter psychroterrae TaxID=2530453 RepID=A0A4R0NCY2_9SPHI|nr:glyoxalase [Pedobacter psychroterrae]TCC98201.1 glyoxalase [Pedobacter psychroterrae]